MKAKNLGFNWQSFLLGVVLCAALVVFIGSKVAEPQTGAVQRTLQRPANMNDVWEKNNDMDARLIAMDERLVSMDKKLNHLTEVADESYKEIFRLKKALGK